MPNASMPLTLPSWAVTGTASGCPQLITIEKALLWCGDASEKRTDTENHPCTTTVQSNSVTPQTGSLHRGYEINSVQTHLHCFFGFVFNGQDLRYNEREMRERPVPPRPLGPAGDERGSAALCLPTITILFQETIPTSSRTPNCHSTLRYNQQRSQAARSTAPSAGANPRHFGMGADSPGGARGARRAAGGPGRGGQGAAGRPGAVTRIVRGAPRSPHADGEGAGRGRGIFRRRGPSVRRKGVSGGAGATRPSTCPPNGWGSAANCLRPSAAASPRGRRCPPAARRPPLRSRYLVVVVGVPLLQEGGGGGGRLVLVLELRAHRGPPVLLLLLLLR